MFLSCEDRANLRTLQIIETEKRFRIRISSFKRGKKDDFWYLLKTHLRFGLNVEAFFEG